MCKVTQIMPVVAIVCGITLSSFGQQTGVSIHRLKKSFAETIAYDQQQQVVTGVARKRPNKEVYRPQFIVDPADVVFQHSGRQEKTKQLFQEPSPLPDKEFNGLEDNNSSIPPDVHGAAGPDHLMITLNTQIRIMDKDGNIISTVGTGSFWHPMPGAGDVFDPKIIYDPYDERWILVMASSSAIQNSALFVAVSENTDPTGNWYLYSFEADPEKKWWFDYPSYGFNKKWIAVSGNMFGNGFGYNVMFVLNKHDLYNGAAQAGYTRFAINDAFTIVPAYTYDPDEEDIYMVMNATGNSGGYGYIKLYRITGSVGSETIEETGLAGIPEPWDSWVGNNGNFAPQKDTDVKINSGDGRIQNVVFRNGKLWCAHHVFLPAGDPTRSAIQWWELTPDATILQYGRIDDTSGFFHYTFPTIAVNAKEDIMIGYSSFSPEQYAGCSYSFRYATDPLYILRSGYEYKEGLATYDKTFGGSRNRWGDYSGTVVDPYDDLDFWTLQEYADLPWGGYDHWGTWWAKIKIEAAPKADFTSHITTVPVGSYVDFTDLSKYEPVEWNWVFEGGTPSASTDQHPDNIIYQSEGVFDVTLIVTNSLGTDTLVMHDFIDANYAILPDVLFAIADTLPCTGAVVKFTDRTTYNPVSWKWEFTPGDVTYLNGSSAVSQHPEVAFNLPVTYSVTLAASNYNGMAVHTSPGLIYAGGTGIPFEEDFESGSFARKAWTIDNPDENKTWEITTTEGNDPGMKSAYINLRLYANLGERDRLISPLINLTGMTNALLEFKYAYAQRFPQFSDSLIVYVQHECGEKLTRILELAEDSIQPFATRVPQTAPFVPQTDSDWCGAEGAPPCHTLDISQFAGSANIRVVFETVSGYGNNLFLDDVAIRSVDNIPLSGFPEGNLRVFPNPSDGRVTFAMNGGRGAYRLEIRNITGRVVYTGAYVAHSDNFSCTLDLGANPPGVYFVSVTNDNRRINARFVIQ